MNTKTLPLLLSFSLLLLFSCTKNFDNLDGSVIHQRVPDKGSVPKELSKQPSIVIMGDGYTLADMGKFAQDALDLEKYLFDPIEGVSPFNYSSFCNSFNIFSIFLRSDERGIGDGKAKNTMLRCYYDQDLIRFDDANFFGGRKAPNPFDVAEQFVPGINLNSTIVVILVNDKKLVSITGVKKGDYGSLISLIPANVDSEDFQRLVIREVGGRGFARLALYGDYVDKGAIKDWYDRYGFFSNVDIVGEPTKVRWSHFITAGYNGVGVNFVASSDVFCPTFSNVMNLHSESLEYDAPSREAIVKRIFSIQGLNYTDVTFNYFFGSTPTTPPRI